MELTRESLEALPKERRKVIQNAPATYSGTPLVEKARRRRAFVFDRDGTIQKNSAPAKEPSSSEISAGMEIRRRTAEYPTIASSAQVVELAMDRATYERSLRFGFKRPPPVIKLADGRYTNNPADVPEWRYLQNFDAFNGFGTGIDVLNGSGAYVHDWPYDVALGGSAWRPSMEVLLSQMYLDGSILTRLGRVDREGEYPYRVDVDRLPYRFQVEDYGPEGLVQKNELMIRMSAAELRGFDVEAVDETSLRKNRYVTYLVPKYACKERGLGRLFDQMALYSGVPVEEFEEIVIAGDTLTDWQAALYGLPRAKRVVFILAADSELSEPLMRGDKEFADVPLMWSRQHPLLTPRYLPTDVPGVFTFKAHRLMPERTIILAHYAPWSRGLPCTESVLACVDQLGYR